MKFEDEHLLAGQIGHFFVLLAFVTSVLSTYAYFRASKMIAAEQKKLWIRYARTTFFIEIASILCVFFSIFFICYNHHFEYLYAYKHASKELEPKYLLACIWEGQEGSFLLWSIWHGVLGTILILKSKEWEAPVMTVINFAQSFIMIMVLGIYVFDVKIGSSPFVLTRNELAGPIFSQPGYLSFIKDGVGLNPLLRNYWMVIHPPILFLGFASTIVPFAFAYAGLTTKKFGDWVKPVIPWALFSCGVLGTGIMMGAKWAYESLSFGGYWAWDPVENASLVPWMIMIAGLHCMAIYKATGNSLRASYLFAILSFGFILYSTFLTRTGILGDSSVHSFTEADTVMRWLIGSFAVVLPVPLLVLYLLNYKNIPSVHVEENTLSREFWMFIGSLIFFLAAMFIIAITSVPVYNKLFNKSIADPKDREFAYNKVMVMVAVIIALLTALSQYLKYRKTEKKYVIRKITWPLLISIAAMCLILIFYAVNYTKQGAGFLGAIYLALFACLFSVVANAVYLWSILKGNVKAGGGAIAHVGFTLMIGAMLVSSGNRQVISDNRKTGLFFPFDKDPTGKETDDPLENLTLLKEVPTQMADYTLTYVADSAAGEKNRTFFTLMVEKKDSASGRLLENFALKPDVYKMKDNNLSSNPDIKHYLFHDVFTYISSLPDRSSDVDTAQFRIHEMNIKDTVFYSKGYLVLNNIMKNPANERFHFSPLDTALVADITVFSKLGTSYKAYPLLSVKNLDIAYKDDTVFSQNLFLRLTGLTDKGKFKLSVKESDLPADFVTLKAYVFPYINFVWLGLVIMVSGIIISLMKRVNAKPLVAALVLGAVVSGLFYMFLLAN